MQMQVYDIPLSAIADNPWQTRLDYDPERLEALAADIRAHGLLQAPVGRLASGSTAEPISLDGAAQSEVADLIAGGAFVELACGHRRLRAVKLLLIALGNTMPVSIRDLSDDDMARLAWAENAQRNDITPWEQAQALDRRCRDLGWTHQQCAERLGLARPTVSGKIRLMRLPAQAKAAFADGSITERQAQALLSAYEDDCDPEILELALAGHNNPDKLLDYAIGGMSADEISQRWRGEIQWRVEGMEARRLREEAASHQAESEEPPAWLQRQRALDAQRIREFDARAAAADGKLAKWAEGGCRNAAAILLDRVLSMHLIDRLPEEASYSTVSGEERNAEAALAMLAALKGPEADEAAASAIALGMEEGMTSVQMIRLLAVAIAANELDNYLTNRWAGLPGDLARALGIEIDAPTSEVAT